MNILWRWRKFKGNQQFDLWQVKIPTEDFTGVTLVLSIFTGLSDSPVSPDSYSSPNSPNSPLSPYLPNSPLSASKKMLLAKKN